MSEKGFDQETVRRAGPASMGDAKTGGHEGAPLGRIDQYDLLCELGGGGFGSVYLARDTVAGVDVAVKGLPPMVRNNAEELERIRENFALVSKLHHPHIAAALHLHPAKEVSYADEPTRQKLRVLQGDTLMVMAYAPGVTLAKWRKQFPEGKVPAPQALEVCRQVAEALDYAHREKVVHRDVKPSNIMVESRVQRTEDRGQRAEYPADLRPPTSDLSVKVLDFGLAAEIRSSMSRVSQEKGDTSGTRPYMAPEQWAGKKQDGRTDQYALAVLFYELVSGAVPFASVFDTGDPVIMSNVVKTESPDPLALLTKAQNAALLRALAKEPAQRFLDCSAFVDALGGRDARGSSKVGRKAWLWLVVEAVVVAVSILYVSSIQSSNEKRAATARAAAASAALDVTQREKAEQARLAAENEKKRKQQEADVRIADEKRKKEDDAARIVEKRKQEALAAEQERLEKANVPAEAQARTVEWLGMSLMPVEAGSFSMGSSSGSTVEKSVHAVLISKLYWMGRTEVTQKQWREVMGDSPSHFKGDDLPVESVDWIRCLAFCEKLTEQEQKEGRLPEGYVYRLPTEAEWEYASRGGAKSRGYTYSGGNDIAVAGWYSDNSGSTTHPVGQKLANELGLYDMSGNVWEWCLDWYGPYSTTNATNPSGVATGSNRVRRGGGWRYGPAECKSTGRYWGKPLDSGDYLGFRIVLAPVLNEKRIVPEEVKMLGPVDGQAWISPTTGMEFVWVPTLKLWVGKYEVTNAEFCKLIPEHNSGSFRSFPLDRPRQPVVNVSKENIDKMLRLMTDTERNAGLLSSSLEYRIPKVDEWLFFAQCNKTNYYTWGHSMPPSFGNFADKALATKFPGVYAIETYNDGHIVACDVQQSGVNQWGIYGTSGNVWEMTVDKSGELWGLGGAWNSCDTKYLRTDARFSISNDTFQSNVLGVRLVLSKLTPFKK